MQDTLHINQRNHEMLTEYRRFLCPSCGKHTVLWLLPTTQIKDLPIKCKRCNKVSVVNVEPISEG